MIGERIATLRGIRGYSQDYMASQLGLAQNTYSQYEHNDEKLNDEILEKIAQILGVTLEDLKNNSPIIISIHNSPNSHWVNSSNNNLVQKEIIDEFISIVKKKDLQFDEMIIIIKKKDEQMDKLIEKLK